MQVSGSIVRITSASILSAGTNYSVGDYLYYTISGGTGSYIIRVTGVGSSNDYTITASRIINPGTGYSVGDYYYIYPSYLSLGGTYDLADGGRIDVTSVSENTGATITQILVEDGGTGYRVGDIIYIGNGTSGVAEAVVNQISPIANTGGTYSSSNLFVSSGDLVDETVTGDFFLFTDFQGLPPIIVPVEASFFVNPRDSYNSSSQLLSDISVGSYDPVSTVDDTFGTDAFGTYLSCPSSLPAFDHRTVSNPPVNFFPTTFTWRVICTPESTISLPGQASSGTGALSGQKYVIEPLQGQAATGNSGYAGFGLSVGVNGIVVASHSSSYIPANLVYSNSFTEADYPLDIVVQHDNANRIPQLWVNGVFIQSGVAASRTVFGALYGTYSSGSAASSSYGGPVLGRGAYGSFIGKLYEASFYMEIIDPVDLPDPPTEVPTPWEQQTWEAGSDQNKSNDFLNEAGRGHSIAYSEALGFSMLGNLDTNTGISTYKGFPSGGRIDTDFSGEFGNKTNSSSGYRLCYILQCRGEGIC